MKGWAPVAAALTRTHKNTIKKNRTKENKEIMPAAIKMREAFSSNSSALLRSFIIIEMRGSVCAPFAFPLDRYCVPLTTLGVNRER